MNGGSDLEPTNSTLRVEARGRLKGLVKSSFLWVVYTERCPFCLKQKDPGLKRACSDTVQSKSNTKAGGFFVGILETWVT